MRNAKVAIAVFLDKDSSYDYTKDVLGIGACIENMILQAWSLGIGSCWLGEILKNKDKVAELLKAPESYELMCVLALGYPDESPKSTRFDIEELAYLNYYGNRLRR